MHALHPYFLHRTFQDKTSYQNVFLINWALLLSKLRQVNFSWYIKNEHQWQQCWIPNNPLEETSQIAPEAHKYGCNCSFSTNKIWEFSIAAKRGTHETHQPFTNCLSIANFFLFCIFVKNDSKMSRLNELSNLNLVAGCKMLVMLSSVK